MKCKIHKTDMEEVIMLGSDRSKFECNECSKIHEKTGKKYRQEYGLVGYPLDKLDEDSIRKLCKCGSCQNE